MRGSGGGGGGQGESGGRGELGGESGDTSSTSTYLEVLTALDIVLSEVLRDCETDGIPTMPIVSTHWSEPSGQNPLVSTHWSAERMVWSRI